MAFNSSDAVDHAELDAQDEAARTKFAARNQWMTENVLHEARVENKTATAKFFKRFNDNGASAGWNREVELWWRRYESIMVKAYGAGDARRDTSNSPTGETLTLVLGTFAAQLRSARCGDVASVAKEPGFGSNCVLVEDIVLCVAGETLSPDWTDVRGSITIKWFKGNKHQKRPPKVHEMLALQAKHALLDPLCWLLVHYQHRGILQGSLQSILDRAALRGDRRIVVNPTAARQPLLLHLTERDILRDGADLKPATSMYLCDRVTQMGLAAGALQRLGGHALRRGVAEDLVAVGNEWTAGTSHAASIALGHNNISERNGLTDHYANIAVTGMLNARASKLLTAPPGANTPDLLSYAEGLTKRTPIAAQPYTADSGRERRWLESRAAAEQKALHPDWSKKRSYTAARGNALSTLRESQLAGLSPREHLGLAQGLQSSTGPSPDIAEPSLALAAAMKGSKPTDTLTGSTTGWAAPDPASATSEATTDWKESESNAALSEEDANDFLMSNNIGSGMPLTDVPVPDIDAICEQVLTTSIARTDLSQVHLAAADSDEPDIAPADGLDHEVLHMPGDQIVEFFTGFNIIKRAAQNQSVQDLALYRRAGRDEPSFMMYKCPRGCGYANEDRYMVEVKHNCSTKFPKIVFAHPNAAKDDPDGAVFQPLPSLTGSKLDSAESDLGEISGNAESHVHGGQSRMIPTKRAHDLTVKQHPPPSTHSPSTQAPNDMQQPQKRVQLPRMARCPVPGCKVKAFVSQGDLRIHLKTRTHGFSDAEATAKAREVWEHAESPGYLAVPR
nr:hypothetical protein B0A51_11562 [Rachicladosporium sp. CCFEE 5018]